MTTPIIRLEIEGMKFAMQRALSEHGTLMDSSVMKAIERYCTADNINIVVQEAATEALDEAVIEEVRDFFKFNHNGRLVVREVVYNYMDKWVEGRL